MEKKFRNALDRSRPVFTHDYKLLLKFIKNGNEPYYSSDTYMGFSLLNSEFNKKNIVKNESNELKNSKIQNQIQKKQKAAVRKKVPKKKKVRRLTDSLMNPRWIWNMPKVFRYITTKTAIR